MTSSTDGRIAIPWRDTTVGLAYREWPGAGDPIVLLHGLSSSSRTWDLVAPLLAPGWRVVALDQRGHGASDKPDDGYDFETMVADLGYLFRRLEIERPLLVGHSWGGNVALQQAVSGAPPTRGLVLLDGGFIEPARHMSWREAEARLRPPDLDMPVEQFRRRLRERLGVRWSPAWEAATLANFWVDADGMIRRHLSIPNHMRIVRAMYDQRPSELFGQVDCQTFLIPCDPPGDQAPDPDRRAAKIESVRLAATALGALGRTVWLDETVHDAQLQRPARVAELIAELAAQAS